MKATTLLKAYVWAEVAFMAYIVLKPKEPGEPDVLQDVETKLKETLDNVTQEPKTNP